MSHRRKVAAMIVVVVAVGSVVLATRAASTSGPWDGWGCPPASIGTSTYDFAAYASGFATAEQALRAEAEFQAADGMLEGERYLEALGSRSGPTRYDPRPVICSSTAGSTRGSSRARSATAPGSSGRSRTASYRRPRAPRPVRRPPEPPAEHITTGIVRFHPPFTRGGPTR